MNNIRPDYFQSTTPIDSILRRIKGKHRKSIVLAAIENDGFETIPKEWLKHDISSNLKRSLGYTQPNLRGGEDLPDLLEGEVEIARVTLLDSVHGEVTSLRARRDNTHQILLRIVNEYWDIDEEGFTLRQDAFAEPLTADEVLYVFRDCEPCASESSCTQEFSSDFYPNLDELADELDIKRLWED
jgi:hypothetical protein